MSLSGTTVKALRVRARVDRDGRLDLPELNLQPGTDVEVIILHDASDDVLLEAAETSLEFWNNEIDDRVWNNA